MKSKGPFVSMVTNFIASMHVEKRDRKSIVSNKRVGIWIDSQKAFVVSMTQAEADPESTPKMKVMRIDSGVESRLRLSGGARTGKTPYGPQDVAVDGKIDARRRRQLHKYYQEIIGNVSDAKKILIFGPGRAKFELEKEMRKTKALASRVLPVETTDKMTENQIAVKVKAFFHPGTE